MNIFRILERSQGYGIPQWGAVASIAGSIISSKMEQDGADERADNANQFTDTQMKNRHQWEVADLKAAGLNPILSAHGTPSIGGSAKADTVPTGERAIKAAEAYTSAKLAKQQIETLKTQAEANQADALNKVATANNTNLNTQIQSKELPLAELKYEAMRKLQNVGHSAQGVVREGTRWMGNLVKKPKATLSRTWNGWKK